VTVSEGRVSVAPGAAEGSGVAAMDVELFRARAGQQVTFSPSAHRLTVAEVDPKVAESWRNGTLEFVGEPLLEVVGEVDRFVKRKIVVAAALQDIRFTGTVSPANIGDWLEALKQIYSVDVVDGGTDEIHIQARGYGIRKR